jgi:hypothetical protein
LRKLNGVLKAAGLVPWQGTKDPELRAAVRGVEPVEARATLVCFCSALTVLTGFVLF